MPITTFLDEDADTSMLFSGDKLIDEMLSAVRSKTGQVWLIQVIEPRYHGWNLFRSRARPNMYVLYFKVGYEYQVINFFIDTEFSINTTVPKSCIVNYLLGYLGGLGARE